MPKTLWLVPLTVTVTAYVHALDDRDAETVQSIAQDSVGLHSKTFGVMLDLDNTKAGDPVESVMQEETLAESIDREEGEEVEEALRTGGWDK